MDSSIIQSSRKPKKIIDINHSMSLISYSCDKDAKWTIKSKKTYYGYKLHMATDINHGFIVSGKITPANLSDTKEIIPLVKDAALKKGAIILAYKGYCSARNREDIVNSGYIPGIMYRTRKGNPLNGLKKKINSIISSMRGAVERVFGTLKRGYGFYRTKYLGITKTRGQFLVSALAFNLKKALNFIVEY